jgi:hypothetical protein
MEGSVPRIKKRVKVITASADPYVKNLLENISEGKRVLNPQKGEKIFSQGDQADAIFLYSKWQSKDYGGVSGGKGSRHRDDWRSQLPR